MDGNGLQRCLKNTDIRRKTNQKHRAHAKARKTKKKKRQG
jgi:hypothetical protein